MKERYWLAGGTNPVPQLTEAGLRFATEHSRLLDLSLFLLQSGLRKVLDSDSLEDAKVRVHLVEFEKHEVLLREMTLIRTVDNALCYIAELLSMIFKCRPEMLKSSEQERLDFILKYETMDQLRKAIAEKKVEKLSFMGLRDLAEYVRSHMGFDLLPDDKGMETAALIVEMRNIFVHNRGVVGTISTKRHPLLRGLEGTSLSISREDLRSHRQILENAVIDMDIRAAIKFNLPTKKMPEPPMQHGAEKGG